MMPFQQLATFLRDDFAILAGELSIKLCSLATKVGTDAEPVNALAQDAALLSSIYRKIGEVMARNYGFSTTIFSHKALDEVQNSARACSLTLIKLNRSIEEASKLTQGRLKLSADGTKLPKDKQTAYDLTQLQTSDIRTEFSEAKYRMLLICHLGDLASDVKISSSLITNYHPNDMGSDLLQGPKRQAMFGSILALQALKSSTSEPPSSPGQSITGPLVAQPSSPAVSLDEDFEIIDTPSTLPGSPVILERDVVEPTFSCALPDRSLPISIKLNGNKRRLSIDASVELDSNTKPRPMSEGRAINTMDQVDSHPKVLSEAGSEDETIHALGNDQNEGWTLLEQQENNRAAQPMVSEQRDKQHVLGNLQEQNQPQPLQGNEAPVSQDDCVSREGMKDEFQAKPPVHSGISEEQLQLYKKNLMLTRPRQQITSQPPEGNHALQDYQMQLMLLEQQNKKRLLMARQEQDATRTPPPPPPPPGGNHVLQDYQMQIMLQEQQDKKRLLMATQGQNAPRAAPPPGGNPAFQQMQMMLQDQQNREGLLMVEREQNAPCISTPPPPAGGNSALQDRQMALQNYETQLRLLNQQHEKRMLMSRQEQDAARTFSTPGGKHALEAYQTEMMRPEQSYKQKLLMAKQEQDRMQSSRDSAAYACQSSNLGTQKIPVMQPVTPSLPQSVTPDMLEKARMVLLKHCIRFSALSSEQRYSFAAQTFIIQDNLARAWAQKSTLLYNSVEQELIRHGMDPEHLTAGQLVAFVAKRPDMKEGAVQVYVRIQKKENQVHAHNLAWNQARGIHACGQDFNSNPNQQQLPKQDANKSKGVELECPVNNEVGSKTKENTQRPQYPSPAPITSAGRQSHGQTINDRSTEILRKHGLKSETLTADQVNLLQSATGEQLERFVKAWLETSHRVQTSNAAPSAHPGLQEQQTSSLCTCGPSEPQRKMQGLSLPQPVAQGHAKEPKIPNMGAPGAQMLTHPSNAAISTQPDSQEQQTRYLCSCCPSEQQGHMWDFSSPQQVAQGHAENSLVPQMGAPGFPSSTQERTSELFRERNTFGNDFLDFHPEERQKHDGIPWQPQSMAETRPELLAGMARNQENQTAQWLARHRADEAHRQREVRLNEIIAERAKELLKADRAKAAEKEKQAEQQKMQQRLAGEHGEQAQKIEVEQQSVRESMKKVYLETVELNKGYIDAQLAKQPRPEKPTASVRSPMDRQRMMQQMSHKRMLAEQAWKKFEAAKKMPERTPKQAEKANDNDAVKNFEEAKEMPVKTPLPAKKATKEEEIKDREKVQKQPLDEEQKAGLKIVEGLLREYTTLYE